MEQAQQRFAALIDLDAFIERVSKLLPNLVAAVIVLGLFYGASLLLRRVATMVITRSSIDATAANFIQTILTYVVMTLGFVSAMGQLGIDITSILTSLGILGLTIGFAARDTLSNIISGLFIFWDRPFVLNDLVDINGNYGRVESITLRSTRIVTVDGRMLAIPNTTIVNSIVASYTNFPNFRVEVEVTIGVTEDIGRVRRLILDLIRADDGFLLDPPAQVVVAALNDYNVALKVLAWIKDERTHIAVTFALRERVFQTLTEAGVDMPFETIQLVPVQVAPVQVLPAGT